MNSFKVLRSLAGVLLLVGLLFATDSLLVAQQDEAAEFDPARWQELVAAKAALVEKFNVMNEQLKTASDEERQKLIEEAQRLRQEFLSQNAPEIQKLAPAAFALNPQDITAAEIMLQIEHANLNYEKLDQIADSILAQQPDHPLALNYGGMANFAMNNFEAAVLLFEKAQQGNVLIPQLGGRFLEAARQYVQYWQKEAGIRRQEAAATGNQQLPRVKMTTAKGEIVLELFENEAPNTVANFISLTEQGYYNGLTFHRVLQDFMAQGGCPNTREGAVGAPGSGGPGYTIKCEAYEPDARRHFGGTLSMAHAGKDTGGSQFFITHLPTPHLDQEVRPESVHTVFGRVIDGMDVVWALRPNDAIERVEVLRKRDHEYKPVTQPSAR